MIEFMYISVYIYKGAGGLRANIPTGGVISDFSRWLQVPAVVLLMLGRSGSVLTQL